MITRREREIQSKRSVLVRVRMEVEPKREEQTSPKRLEETEKRLRRRYPTARAPTEIIAMRASPLILEF